MLLHIKYLRYPNQGGEIVIVRDFTSGPGKKALLMSWHSGPFCLLRPTFLFDTGVT